MIASTLCFLFCWSVVVFTSTWHLYFRVTYSDTAAPGYHRFILKVRRMKHMNFGVPGGPTLTMGHFRLERLLTGVSGRQAWLVGAEVDSILQYGGWMSMLDPGDRGARALLTRDLGQSTTVMTTIQTCGSFWNGKMRSCLPTISCWSQSWMQNIPSMWRWCTKSAQSLATSDGLSASRGTPLFR